MIGKTGKVSLKRRIKEFRVDLLSIELAVTAKCVYEKFSKTEVRDTSAGAATFYVWVSKKTNILGMVCQLKRLKLSAFLSLCIKMMIHLTILRTT